MYEKYVAVKQKRQYIVKNQQHHSHIRLKRNMLEPGHIHIVLFYLSGIWVFHTNSLFNHGSV